MDNRAIFYAGCVYARLINIYNSLRHFVQGREKNIDKIEQKMVSLEDLLNDKSLPQYYFKEISKKNLSNYTNDLRDKISQVKRNDYEPNKFIEYMEQKISELDFSF
ncbi:MAG: hypothetical protein PHQ66_00815 [Candidatus Nanoarchaeia archaeon]|nr:hypothetical protein [Candidatus Nanoarchaeia archaeon]MDD5358480.1 hypothetical protein [Candidatus Nanoarchaeia archaeon]MDD5588994.1 hypothetical protein [Candidatus Nanoarchaeia archaeon]